MKRIPLENAKPGQILAQKLTRQDGVLLANQGSEITEGLLRMLSRMNVDTIVVEEDSQLGPQELEEIFETRKAELEARFVRVAEQPVLMALRKALVAQAAKERDEALAALGGEASAEAGKNGADGRSGK